MSIVNSRLKSEIGDFGRMSAHFENKSEKLKENESCFYCPIYFQVRSIITDIGTRCSSVVRAFTHGAMGRRIDPSCGKPTELILVPASAPRLV